MNNEILSDKRKMEVIVAAPRGFCAGVVRAITTVRNMMEKYGRPIYVLHEIVHNKHVIADLDKTGCRICRGP